MDGRIVVIGAEAAVGGYRLGGAVVVPVEDAAQARAAWRDLPADTAVVIVTPPVARLLSDVRPGAGAPLVTVLPSPAAGEQP